MKHSDLEAQHQQDLQDWQKRGVDGIVKAVDPAAGTVTISVRGKDVVIHSSNTTVIRRYAPDSVKFDDAKPSTLQEIHPGDQVRARGERNADGSELAADEIVSGSFRNIAGTINSVDASSSTLSVHDLLSNKTVLVKITQDSLLRQLPPRWLSGSQCAGRERLPEAPADPLLVRRRAPTPSPARPVHGSGRNGREHASRWRSGFSADAQPLAGYHLADLHKGEL